MGKIAEYFERCRQDEEERKRNETVAKLAKELNKSVDFLISQLQAAGVKKVSETDQITETDKQALLQYLKKSHRVKGRQKKISLAHTWESEEQRLVKAVAAQKNGAERECLEHLASHAFWGNTIDPNFQAVVNLILAKAIFYEALPLKKLGRPKSQETENLGRQVAQEYWDMLDSGTGYSEAVQHLANKVHKDERQIMRYVEKHKNMVGLTVKLREQNREWAVLMRNMIAPIKSAEIDSCTSMYLPVSKPLPELEPDDYIEYFDEQIAKLAHSKSSTDTK
jgi:hypothetical protein